MAADNSQSSFHKEPWPNIPEVAPGMTEREKAAPDEESRLLDKVVYDMSRGYDHWDEIYEGAREDAEFIYQEQWDADIRRMRESSNRPCITLNELANHLAIVDGNMRQNRYAVKVHRKSGLDERIPSADPLAFQANVTYPNAEVMAGIIRDIEARSNA